MRNKKQQKDVTYKMDEGKYDDIIHLSHPVSKKYPQMDLLNRAAQFSPFAALTGHEEAIEEMARVTDEKLELDENIKERINIRLQMLKQHLMYRPEVTVTLFKPDERKCGGSYVMVTGIVKKIDEYERRLVLEDGTLILFAMIVDIDGAIFD